MTSQEIKELKQRLLESLAAPQEVETESGRVKRQSVSQMIKALDYLEKNGAALDDEEKPALRRAGLYKIRNKD